MQHNIFSDTIIAWYQQNKRDLPWRDIDNAYYIWLSEVILQQTRVAQGMDYYLRFIQTFPTVRSLAEASEDDVLKLWQGLGYYSRARNLHKAAQQVMQQYQGVFPTSYAELLKLQGVGPYTAAAIASFTTNEPVAVVDGNVFRVLARLFNIDTPIDTQTGKKIFGQLAREILNPQLAGIHNQAMMEFGALQCTPSSPHCTSCPLLGHCEAYACDMVQERPVKQGRTQVRQRYLHYLIFKYNRSIWIHRRGAGDIWQGLYEFVLLERQAPTPIVHLLDSYLKEHQRKLISSITPILTQVRHQLTHQTLWCDFYLIDLTAPIELDGQFTEISVDEWKEKAVPKIISEANRKLFYFF